MGCGPLPRGSRTQERFGSSKNAVMDECWLDPRIESLMNKKIEPRIPELPTWVRCRDCHSIEQKPFYTFNRCHHCHASVCPSCETFKRGFQQCLKCLTFLCDSCFYRNGFLIIAQKETEKVLCLAPKPPKCHYTATVCVHCVQRVCVHCHTRCSAMHKVQS